MPATERVRWKDGSWHTFSVGRRGLDYDLGWNVCTAMVEENEMPAARRKQYIRIRARKAMEARGDRR